MNLINHRTISMEPHSVGDLLTEVARAHLHQGLPSALLTRLKAGVDKFLAETTEEGSKALATYLSGELELLILTWKKKEDSFYGM